MILTIPKQDRPTFEYLLRMSREDFQKLVRAVRTASPSVSVESYSSNVAEVAAKLGLESDDVRDVVNVLSALYPMRDEDGLSAEELAHELSAAARVELGTEPADQNWTRFENDLLALLSSDDSLGVTSKASELVSESERRFCPTHSRIVSDIRPVFTGPPAQAPAAAMVIHSFKLAYHEGQELKEFFVTLDGNDLRQVQALIERAITKEISLRTVVNDKTRILGVGGEVKEC